MEKQYVLDSNICIHLLRNRKEVVDAIAKCGWDNCHISELTVVELLYGAECSSRPDENRMLVKSFLSEISILPFTDSIENFCRQKARLRKQGKLIEDADLYIGCAALTAGYTLVTENIKHLSRIEGLAIINWVHRS